MEMKESLPNATLILILGIASIITTCFCYGTGIVLGIVALNLSKKDIQLYRANPDQYTNYDNVTAGKICAIIGVALNALVLLMILLYLFVFGTVFWNMFPWLEMLNEEY